MFRLRETGGGGVALETWMVDHDGRGLAGISRELAFLDAQGGRPQRFAGRARRSQRAVVRRRPVAHNLTRRTGAAFEQ